MGINSIGKQPAIIGYKLTKNICLLWKGEVIMLRWALIFFVVAVIAAFFGFIGIAGAAIDIAKIIFYIFLILFVISLVAGMISGKKV